MAKNKATHLGHCQVCGALQKLPGGVLAKHGYTVQWGFFEGTCHGAGHLPFEQDISLIQGAITRARDLEADTRADALRVRVLDDPADCYYHAYFDWGWVRGRKSGYEWIKTRIDTPADAKVPGLHYWHPGDSEPARWEQAGYYGADGAFGAASYFNGQYADRCLVPKADRLHQYILWQQGRIADWTPQPLTPIEEAK